MIKKEKIVITIVLVVSCITATPVAAKNVENNTYQICRNDIFIDWYQLNCKKIISEIKISPDVVDCIVFWTKNPLPMMERLDELEAYNYYFQFTLTGYGNDVEINLPNKKTKMIPVFQELSEKIGKQKVIWRYDPIFFSDRYTKEYHLKAFKSIAEALSGYTEKCVISFVDIYPKNKKKWMDCQAMN